MGYRRDDSSLDSLVEREYFQHEETGSGSPQAHKSHLSPSNLSRDSGLTLSDTQLYEEDTGAGGAGCPYPGETVAGRFYQRSASSNLELDQHQHQDGDDWLARSMVDSRALESRRGDMSHPHRLGREGKKKSRDSSEGSDGESGPASFRSRPPFKHSSSSPLLDIQPRNGGKAGGAELKPCLTHPPIGKRISSDSIGEEDEGQFDHESYVSGHPHPHPHQHPAGQPGSAIDFRRLRLNKDMGTIVKSNSGTHLFLSDDTLPTRYNLTRGQGKSSPLSQTPQHQGKFFLRQSSVTESAGSPTPPTSPEVKFAKDDSTVTKTNASSTPEPTNNRSQIKPAPWEPEMNSAYRDWDGQLANNFNAGSMSLAFSKSTSDLRAQDYADDEAEEVDDQDKTITADNVSKLSSRPESPVLPPSPKAPPHSPKLWGGRKSHEAEEVADMRRKPHFSLMLRPESDYGPLQSQPHRKQSLGLPPQHLIKGSPPPNVILQSLSVSKKEVSSASLPLRASYDSAILSQVRRSSADLATHSGRDIIKSINSIRPEEYVSVTSKPIMITSSPGDIASEESSSNSTLLSSPVSSSSPSTSSSLTSPRPSLSPLSSTSARRAKLAKYMMARSDTTVPSKDQTTEGAQQRPEKPPNYHQALQRNFMIKHSVPIDITDDDTGKQRELNAKAKALYEKSLQIYNEQRVSRTKEENSPCSAQKDSETQSNSPGEESVIDRGNSYYDNSVHSARADKKQVRRSMPHNFKTSSAYLSESPPSQADSAFLDLGSISHSLQTDVLSRREKHQARSGLGAAATAISLSTLPTPSEDSGVSASLSRHDSRLSDVSGSSSGGSTITISTLGRPSDTSSGSRASMASSVASSTGADSSAESPHKQQAGSEKDFRSMNYSRHFRPQDGGEEEGNVSRKDERKERGRKELEWTSEGEGVYVTLKKNPQQLYLESMKLYEEKQIPSSLPSSSKSSSLPASFPAPSTESKSVQSQIAHFHSQLPQSSTSKSYNPDTVHKNSRDRARPKSVHDVYSLQRSQSDASDSSARPVRPSPRVKTSGPRQSQLVESGKTEQPDNLDVKASAPSQSPRLAEVVKPEQQQPQQQQQQPPTSARSGPSDMPSDYHQNFLKARSCFYNPEMNNNQNNVKPSSRIIVGGSRKSTPSTYMLSSSQSVSNLSNVRYDNRLTALQFTEDLTVESGHSPRSKSNVPIKSKLSTISASTLSLSTSQSSPSSSTTSKSNNQGKRELPWSVKSLKSLYDKDLKDSDKSGPSGQPQPPPYQDPPPFRRLQEHSRVSTSSSSSAGSEVSAEPGVRKSGPPPGSLYRSGGPQAFTEGLGSYSSSEEGYNSSLERRSRRSLDSSQEALSDHTNITYV